MPTIYLAGPEVFLPDAQALMAQKRRLARQFGFEPTGPGSDENQAPSGILTADAIYRRNDLAMRKAEICLANITPFRGISADPGTVYEIGFMIALGKRVWAYSNHPDDYGRRVEADWYRGQALDRTSGRPRGPDGLAVEEHGMADNLMIDGGITATGGQVLRAATIPADPARDLAVYEQALVLLAQSVTADRS
ncbi:nucleoside 2-deoxyribosyltransferase [Xaviernesmea oryzae]|uniref:Nucleoside 2-deoxyribosyltransferase n=1 Tax=Xaviernesmea oryzae TaxID=464029 RepID=A0A1Q9B1R4_9HYPH|nr:nucleoside 2-deoxyribosyltransferase [Xaviernesmea oryzae]OLP61932.1 nucleoside 2-deoxyribosyltransferase [Xaviernesmea oryzae]SEL00894.1 Nucleoside 2-deoxyribosyltransferase [Xaviernesmea oryzae]